MLFVFKVQSLVFRVLKNVQDVNYLTLNPEPWTI